MKSFNKFLDVPTVTESIADQPLTAMPPAQIILTRVNFRSFGNDLSIALFYAKALDRYFTVPFTTRVK